MRYPSFAPNLQIVSPHAALWHTFDSSLKADLFSTAISTAEATWLIDPIPLVPASLRELQTQSPIKGIIVTNQNHWRASADFSEELSAPIFAHPVMRLDKAPPFTSVADGDQLGETLEVITIEGAGPGEIALFTELDGGTMIVGDAMINFQPYGFTFLPRKYCANYAKMRQSLRRLADCNFRQIFFAHGPPIIANAKARLNGLLNES